MIKQALNIGKLKDLQFRQYFNCLIVSGEVPKAADGGTATGKINITNAGDFAAVDVTGKFSTLIDDNDTIKDDGTNHLSVKISDARNLELYDDFVPLDLFLTPGRVRTMGVLVDAAGGVPNASHQLFIPKKFPHVFAANNDIVFEFKNDANTVNYFWIAFFGERVRNPLATEKRGIQPMSKL